MIYEEKRGDLFSAPDDVYFVQCISSDFGCGKGIAVQFNRHFNTKVELMHHYRNYKDSFEESGRLGDCLVQGRVLNLITKKHYWEKPTYQSLLEALNVLKTICTTRNIRKLAMPKIACGLDRLVWEKVSKMIMETFSDMDIEVTVYVL